MKDSWINYFSTPPGNIDSELSDKDLEQLQVLREILDACKRGDPPQVIMTERKERGPVSSSTLSRWALPSKGRTIYSTPEQILHGMFTARRTWTEELWRSWYYNYWGGKI